jgi:predicted metal-dependent hydrolase
LPEYRIKRSKKAKYISLKFSLQDGLEVIIPQNQRIPRKSINKILYEGRFWIEATRKRIARQRNELKKRDLYTLPGRMRLLAIDRDIKVVYNADKRKNVTIDEQGNVLALSGAVRDSEACRLAFRKWMSALAHDAFAPILEGLSRQTGLSYKKIVMRGQKTRWASCSSMGTISLNFKLLFLPPDVVRYVMIHELCHTVHMNHSRDFWMLVKKYEKDFPRMEMELRVASRHMPLWV